VCVAWTVNPQYFFVLARLSFFCGCKGQQRSACEHETPRDTHQVSWSSRWMSGSNVTAGSAVVPSCVSWQSEQSGFLGVLVVSQAVASSDHSYDCSLILACQRQYPQTLLDFSPEQVVGLKNVVATRCLSERTTRQGFALPHTSF